MEAAKHKNEEQNPQEQPKKAWIKPVMEKLDIETGINVKWPVEVNAYTYPS